MNLQDSICRRRTYYALSGETPVEPQHIRDLVELALRYTPSAFNMQSARLLLTTGKMHRRLWDETLTALKKVVPAKQLAATTDKINSFKEAYGTVLFFDDEQVIGQMIEKYPLYEKAKDMTKINENTVG